MGRMCRPSPPCVLVTMPGPGSPRPQGRDLMEGDNRFPGSTPESQRTLKGPRGHSLEMPPGCKIPEDAQEELRSQRRQRRLAPGPPRGLRGLTPGSSLRGAGLEAGESRDPMMFS